MIHKSIYCRQRTLPSLGIRVFDGMRQWSHVAGILDDHHAIEALAFSGVVIVPIKDIIDRSSEWKIIEVDVPDRATGDLWALHTVGTPYDWFGAIGVPWNRDWQSPHRQFCSEHREMWLEMSGLKRFRAGTRGISPNDSYAVL